MKGFICNKCGKSWRENWYSRSHEIPLTETQVFMDDFLGSRGMDLCPKCSAEYIEQFIKPQQELYKKKLEWFGMEK